jgi:hypothetical protein
MAIGGGLLFDLSANNGVKDGDAYAGMTNVSFGANFFFDISYVEIGLYYAFGSITQVVKYDGDKETDKGGNLGQFGFSLLGKYPIEAGSLVIWPALGVDYNMVLSYKYEGEKVLGDESASKWMSQFGILAGLGLDISITEKLFFRGSGMFHLRLPNKLMKDLADLAGGDAKATMGIGPRVNLAIGYKL